MCTDVNGTCYRVFFELVLKKINLNPTVSSREPISHVALDLRNITVKKYTIPHRSE